MNSFGGLLLFLFLSHVFRSNLFTAGLASRYRKTIHLEFPMEAHPHHACELCIDMQSHRVHMPILILGVHPCHACEMCNHACGLCTGVLAQSHAEGCDSLLPHWPAHYAKTPRTRYTHSPRAHTHLNTTGNYINIHSTPRGACLQHGRMGTHA